MKRIRKYEKVLWIVFTVIIISYEIIEDSETSEIFMIFIKYSYWFIAILLSAIQLGKYVQRKLIIFCPKEGGNLCPLNEAFTNIPGYDQYFRKPVQDYFKIGPRYK